MAFDGLHFLQSIKSILCVLVLVNCYQSVEDENKQDDEWLNVSCDAFLAVTGDSDNERDGCGQKKNSCK